MPIANYNPVHGTGRWPLMHLCCAECLTPRIGPKSKRVCSHEENPRCRPQWVKRSPAEKARMLEIARAVAIKQKKRKMSLTSHATWATL